MLAVDQLAGKLVCKIYNEYNVSIQNQMDSWSPGNAFYFSTPAELKNLLLIFSL